MTENLVTMVERKSMSTDTLCSGISCQTGLLFAADLRIILISFIYGPVFSAMLIYNPACQPTQDMTIRGDTDELFGTVLG